MGCERLLQGLDLAKLVGIEIGPLDRPMVHKSQGTVYYIDHLDTEALKAQWQGKPDVDVSRLHVDAVWGELSLKKALERDVAQDPWVGADYLVASHVIEHVPDLVAWLREIREVLREGGALRLVVPDGRYTFDYLRRTSTLPEVVDAFVRKRRTPSGSRVLDFTFHAAHVDCLTAWRGEIDREHLKRWYTDEGALALGRDAEESTTYHDVHCWVFTPETFVDLMGRLAECGLLEFACEWISPTPYGSFEFLAALRPESNTDVVRESWTKAAKSLVQDPAPADAAPALTPPPPPPPRRLLIRMRARLAGIARRFGVQRS